MNNGNILAINSGSTSIKYRLFSHDKNELAAGQLESVTDYDKALKDLLRQVITHGEISHVLHRIVHGGTIFYDPVIINQEVIDLLEKNNHLAPLHNPYNIMSVRAAIGFMPEARQIAVFDTGFYKNLPYEAAHYALAPDLAKHFGFRRYGFHGLSHEYAMRVAKRELKLERQPNLITAHLGGGASITAISGGRPLDTSMGYTPNEGLIMMSRTGDIDANLILDLLTNLPGELTLEKIEQTRNIINKESGLKALAGYADFRDLLADANLGKQPAEQAFNMYLHRLVKYIGGYHALLAGKVDALVLTGSIGSGNPITKEQLTIKLHHLKLPIITVKTNEELMMVEKAHEHKLL